MNPGEILARKRIVRRFRTPLKTARGVFSERESLVIRLRDSQGRIGYGEVAPWPGFAVESLAEAEAILQNKVGAPGPCLAAALSHARAWADEDWGRRTVAMPVAALVRDADEARRCHAAGHRVFKIKIGLKPAPDEIRDIAALLKIFSPNDGATFRLDANGALDAAGCSTWCAFLNENPTITRLEQPLPPGLENEAVLLAGDAAGKLALDESVRDPRDISENFPGVRIVKPLLLGDLGDWRKNRAAIPPAKISYSSVFATPFGRQAELCVASEHASGEAEGFGTLGAFDDTGDLHAPGSPARSLSEEPSFWEALWERL